MKSILKKDRILVFIALLGLLASLAPLAARTKAEQSNRYYDYILDYSSLRYMASQSTQSEGCLLYTSADGRRFFCYVMSPSVKRLTGASASSVCVQTQAT